MKTLYLISALMITGGIFACSDATGPGRGDPVETRFTFGGVVRIEGVPVHGATVVWPRCTKKDLEGRCTRREDDQFVTDLRGQYILRHLFTRRCVRGAPLNGDLDNLRALVPIDGRHRVWQPPDPSNLVCTEDKQVVDFNVRLVLIVSGTVTSTQGPLAPTARVELWREGGLFIDPPLAVDRSKAPAADGSYRFDFGSCYVDETFGETRISGHYFVQAVDPVNMLRSERHYIPGCEPKDQVVNLVLEPQ